MKAFGVKAFLGASVSALVLAANPAFAQTAPEAESDQEGLGEVVVTAQRRQENLQDVPISVAAISAESASLLGVTDPQNLSQLVPGFYFSRQASGSTPFVRGVGTLSTFVGNEPSVAFFVDDTYIPTGNAAIFEFNNIEGVEMLKGPQGTLFGRNATGGVIHVHTRDPSLSEASADISVGYGNYDTTALQFYGSVPLSDTVAVNLTAFSTDQEEGWGTNFVDGSDVYTNDSWGARAKLLIEPSNTLSMLLALTHSERLSDQGMALRVAPGMFGHGNYSGEALGLGFYDGAVNLNNFYDTTYDQLSFRLDHDMGVATFRSITAYSEADTHFELDLDASPTNRTFAAVDNWAHTFTQEFQLLSPSDSQVSWILGAYIMIDESFFGLNAIGTSIPGSATVPGGQGAGNYNFEDSTQDTESYSAYAQVTTEIVPDTNLTIGVRYTSDTREESGGSSYIGAADGTPFVFPGPVPAPGPAASPEFGSETEFTAVTGRIALDHRFTDDFMGYIAYNRGFKSGVYNLAGYAFNTTAPLPPADPEVLDAYTIGFKSEWFDNRLRFNVEGYYYEYTNIQVQNNVPPPNVGTVLVNGGAATIQGVDIDLSYAATQNLIVSFSANVQEGSYDEFNNGPTFFPLPPNTPIAIPAGCPAGTVYPADSNNGSAQLACSLAGNDTVLTPPLSTTLSVIYTLPTSAGDFDFSASWSHGGDFYFEPDNISFSRQPTYDLINASVRWTSPSESFDIRLWGNNLLEEEYYSYVANSASSGTKIAPAAPLTYGIAVGYHF